MSSTTKASIAASATALLSITTPFVQPSDCEMQWKTTSLTSTADHDTPLFDTVLVSEPATSCYPFGWDLVAPESLLSFSPGVCPDGWTYHYMGEDGSRSATTAFCCNSGFTYISTASHPPVDSLTTNWCSWGGWTARPGNVTKYYTTRSSVNMVHKAWAVTWAASDTSTLTPKLPTITSSMIVPKWTPGEEIPDGLYDAKSDQDSTWLYFGDFTWFLVIGVPLISLLIIGCSIWGCMRCYRSSQQGTVIYVVNGTIPPRTYEMDARVQNG